jgi:ankyrin repeat protein
MDPDYERQLIHKINQTIDLGHINDSSILELSDDQFKKELTKIKDLNAPTARRNCYSSYYFKISIEDYTISDLSHSWTLLKWAFYRSNLSKVRILLENGADLHFKLELNDDPPYFLIGSYNCPIEMIDLCLKYNANLNYQNHYGNTLLHIKTGETSFDFYKALIDKGADINIRNNKGLLPIHSCIYINFLEGNLLKFQYLLQLQPLVKNELLLYIIKSPHCSHLLSQDHLELFVNILKL